MFGSFLMFHWVRGVPFEFNAGAYDNLNMWEQIDNGAQYTPAKKFLMSVPIVLFLISTHYTHYDLTYFIINFLAVLGVVIPKLPYVSFSQPKFPISYFVLEMWNVRECCIDMYFSEPPNSSWSILSARGQLQMIRYDIWKYIEVHDCIQLGVCLYDILRLHFFFISDNDENTLVDTKESRTRWTVSRNRDGV